MLWAVVSIASQYVINVKALVDAFNPEKALAGAFSVIVNSSRTFIQPSFEALVSAHLAAAASTGGPATWAGTQPDLSTLKHMWDCRQGDILIRSFTDFGLYYKTRT